MLIGVVVCPTILAFSGGCERERSDRRVRPTATPGWATRLWRVILSRLPAVRPLLLLIVDERLACEVVLEVAIAEAPAPVEASVLVNCHRVGRMDIGTDDVPDARSLVVTFGIDAVNLNPLRISVENPPADGVEPDRISTPSILPLEVDELSVQSGRNSSGLKRAGYFVVFVRRSHGARLAA